MITSGRSQGIRDLATSEVFQRVLDRERDHEVVQMTQPELDLLLETTTSSSSLIEFQGRSVEIVPEDEMGEKSSPDAKDAGTTLEKCDHDWKRHEATWVCKLCRVDLYDLEPKEWAEACGPALIYPGETLGTAGLLPNPRAPYIALHTALRIAVNREIEDDDIAGNRCFAKLLPWAASRRLFGLSEGLARCLAMRLGYNKEDGS